MPAPKLSKLQLEIMDVLWTKGTSSIREIQEGLPARRRLAYTTVQTLVYRLEIRGAVRRARKIGNAHIFEAMISRRSVRRSDVSSISGARSSAGAGRR